MSITQQHTVSKNVPAEYKEKSLLPVLQLLNVADMAINRTYLPECVNYQVDRLDLKTPQEVKEFKSCTKVFRVKRFVYNPEESITEKLKTFFLSLYHLPLDPSVFYIIRNILPRGTRNSRFSSYEPGEFSFHIGLRTEAIDNSFDLKNMLQDSFSGTFLGSDLIEDQVENIKIPKEIKNLVCVSAIPSVKKDSDDSTAEIGLEQFIDVMRNKDYTAVLIASPVSSEVIQQRKRDLENLYTRLSVNRKQTLQFGENESDSVSEGISNTTGVSSTIGKSFTQTTSRGHTSTRGGGESDTLSYTSGSSYSSGSSGNGYSSSSGSSSSTTSSHTTSSNWSESESWGISNSEGTTSTEGTSESHSQSLNVGKTKGKSKSISIECENKNVVDMLTRISEMLKHISDSEAYGLWECAAYFTSNKSFDAMFAANNFRALVLGDSSSTANCYINHWECRDTPPNNQMLRESERKEFERTQMENKQYINELFSYVKHGMHPRLRRGESGYYGNDSLFQVILPTHAVSGRDLPCFLPMPLKSVPGVVVDSIAAFERSIYTRADAEKLSKDKTEKNLRLGEIIHMGQKEKDSVVNLSLDKLTSHTFIAGSTGSGKSNTMSVILSGLIKEGVNFLVVEPAKGEYKQDFHEVTQIPEPSDTEPRPINIFTTNPLCERLLHLNPFRFDPGIHVLEHVDRLLNIFGSCWELTAAMPAILKRAVEQSYESVGWDLGSSCFIESGAPCYPTFSTVVQELNNVIDNSGYSPEAKSNYRGALVTRVESLAGGILRQIFCSEKDISDKELFDSRTIIDLSRLGSPETKTLIMGVIVMLLSEYRMANAKETNRGLKHVTVLEEAHNLLKNANNVPGGSAIVSKSVEMISNAIAEMRTYGEGFIIVDQSPTAVDISAIKNTNTKIVMRLPEQRDCEAMASAMGLNEFQQIEIAKLGKGRAIVMQNDWTAAVMVAIDKADPDSKLSGTPEVVNKDEYRRIRTKLALLIAKLGYKFFIFQWKASQNEQTVLTWETVIKGKTIREMWDETILAFHEECKKSHIGKAKTKEILESCEYYSSEFDTSKLTVAESTRILFARMLLSILQCEKCWRKYLEKNNPPGGAVYPFQKIMNQYLSSDVLDGQTENVKKLVDFIQKFLYIQGVLVYGGSPENQVQFRKLYSAEANQENNNPTIIGRSVTKDISIGINKENNKSSNNRENKK